jgi:hypothetical protein
VAYVLGPSAAFASVWTGKPVVGVELAYGSLAWARRSGNRRLSAFAATVAARAHARLGEGQLCRRMLGEAEDELGRHPNVDADPIWLSVFDAAGLAGHRGSCLLALGEPRAAIAALQEEDETSPSHFVRNRIIWRLECAEAHLQLGDVDAACSAVEKALEYAESGPVSPRVLRVFRTIDLRLRAYPSGCAEITRGKLRAFIVANE